MNVYDEAYKLEKAIKESEEYKQFMEMKSKIDEKPEIQKMVNDFQEKQIQMQAEQMMADTDEAKEEAVKKMAETMQELSQIMMKDPLIAQYMQAEMRFSVMMNDIYKIFADVMGIGNLM